ncbi:hypothetical protein [Streptomyces sp. 3N207]|uniref:hypothetical protein n=1 Tax=Streptomyces sp. 3N207 TaxID=3457417 RepID=UPI003FD65C17
MRRRTRVVVGAVAVLCAAVSVGLVMLVVVRDLNTAGQAAGIVGSVASLAAFVLALYALYQPPATPAPGTGEGAGAASATGPRSVTVSGSVGRAVTGDNNRLSGAAPDPHVPPGQSRSGGHDGAPVPETPGTPRAGERAVSAGGDIGEVVTGDGNTLA